MDEPLKAFADTLRTLEADYYTDAELALWLQSPQPLLDGKTPLELLAAGRKVDLHRVIQQMDECVYI